MIVFVFGFNCFVGLRFVCFLDGLFCYDWLLLYLD